METAGHNAIGGIKCLFDAISMVAVNVNIQHARIGSEELENTQNNIVDITEPSLERISCTDEVGGEIPIQLLFSSRDAGHQPS